MSSRELREGLLFGMGNPLLDICASTEDDFLEKYNLKPNNAILAEEKHKPLCSEMAEKYNVEYIAGGSVQNAMRVAQWILQKPRISVFFGAIGIDRFGQILEAKAKEAGVRGHYYYHKTESTGTCAVVITKQGQNRSLCASLAAANCFSADHLHKPENKAVLENAQYYYVSGFFLTVSPESALEVAGHACKTNKIYCMNLSAPFISQFYKDPLMKLMPYVDILFGNETEAATFAQEQNLGVTSVPEISLKICDLPKENQERERLVIITQGCDPVVVAHNGKITEYPATRLNESQIIDTNGAGDAFVGGFLAQYIQGKSVDICVKCGVYAATEIIQQSGCTFPAQCKFVD